MVWCVWCGKQWALFRRGKYGGSFGSLEKYATDFEHAAKQNTATTFRTTASCCLRRALDRRWDVGP